MRADPPPLAARIFHRLLALNFLIAWISLASQERVLYSSRGLLPIASYLRAVRDANIAWWRVPTMFWLWSSDRAILVFCIAGAILAVLAMCGILPRVMTGVQTALYIGFAVVGQAFLSFQWDNLLIECGALAIFLPTNRRVPWTYVLFRLLLFKLYFESGIAKAESPIGDWWDGSAMTFYYQTAPLPTALAAFAHALPAWWHHLESRAMLAVELLFPFAAFAPRVPRLLLFFVLTIFQLINFATANYGFFITLSVALHVFLLDDADLARVRDRVLSLLHLKPVPVPEPAPAPDSSLSFIAPILVLTIFCLVSFDEALATFINWTPTIADVVAPLRAINTYHLFASITRDRIEPEFQTSDGRTWIARDLYYKPGDVTRAPPLVAPHQPRVDFQLWFYGLSYAHRTPAWVEAIVEKLCRAPDDVQPLFAAPLDPKPRAVRIAFWRYRFSTGSERRATGAWWQREAADVTEAVRCEN